MKATLQARTETFEIARRRSHIPPPCRVLHLCGV